MRNKISDPKLSNNPSFAVVSAAGGGTMQWLSVRGTLIEAQGDLVEYEDSDEHDDECLFIIPLAGFVQFA